jgi:pyruvate dehydrogenase E2 component (dihydrolipoamide acetyltransferase)
MPIEIVMPKLGLTMAEGVILEWKKKEGDTVKKGDILFVLETEKVTYEVESPEDGVLGRIIIQEKETVPVGQIVGYLLRPGDSLDSLPSANPVPSGDPAAASVPSSQEMIVALKNGHVKATPLAKKMARNYNLNISGITGTGPKGRIVSADVENVRKAASMKSAEISSAAAIAPLGEERIVPLTGMRRTIARKMLQSKVEAAQTYMSNTVDASKLQECRRIILPYVEKRYGVRITITDLMMKITGAAIREHPVINTRWTDQGIVFISEVHMGMAMALDEGLIVPVIRNINSKTIGQVAVERTALIKKGKTNSFSPDDIKGSTFTLSAMGMFGIEEFTAIINQPENAILAVAAIIEKPVGVNGNICLRPTMNINLSYDHRTIDGAEAGKFMQTLKAFIEEPILILS